MSQRTSNFIRLKQVLSPVDQAHQGVATTIGLLAFFGLNHIQQMPEMCHLLQRFFNLNSCGFFWSDPEGNMQDAWCLSPDFLSFKTLMTCREYQTSGNRAWPTFQENVLMGVVAGYLLPFQNERFYASPHYQTPVPITPFMVHPHARGEHLEFVDEWDAGAGEGTDEAVFQSAPAQLSGRYP